MSVSTPDDGAVPKGRLEKTVVFATVVIPLLATVIAIVLLWNKWVNTVDLVLLGVFYVLTAMGIGVGFHRLLTHHSFESPAPVRAFLLILGSMAVQGPAIEWAATHLKHHAKSDKEGDPHSPLDGLWHAHLGWLFRDPSVRDTAWGKPYRADPVVRFVDRTFFLWAGLGIVIPGLIGYGFGGFKGFLTGALWGGLVRVFLVHHVTWSVNSVCHTWGKREFESNDRSHNHWIVGLLGLGEGWHNNHHAFPKAAYHGMRWWQVDVNALVIRLLKVLRLARNVWMPTPEAMEARRLRKDREQGA